METAPVATSAISAASSPYSRRSCPSSAFGSLRLANRSSVLMAAGDCIVGLLKVSARPEASLPASAHAELRRRGSLRLELVGDRLEDRLHAAARRLDGRDRDERDQRDEQGVLEQVLAFLVTDERLHSVHELHDIPL